EASSRYAAPLQLSGRGPTLEVSTVGRRSVAAVRSITPVPLLGSHSTSRESWNCASLGRVVDEGRGRHRLGDERSSIVKNSLGSFAASGDRGQSWLVPATSLARSLSPASRRLPVASSRSREGSPAQQGMRLTAGAYSAAAAVVWSPSAARSLPAPYNNNHILNNNNNNNLYPALTTAPSMVVAASTAVSTVPARIASPPLVTASGPVSTSYGVPHGSYTTVAAVAPGFQVNQLGHT
ncbi:unnamed protein product, partial [Polarella glacialis]